jgi:hypothetical protein
LCLDIFTTAISVWDLDMCITSTIIFDFGSTF